MRIDRYKAVLCLRLLLEGNSIRSVERITRVNQNTIMSLLETIGRRAKRYWATKMQNLPAADVECDEVWAFIGCKEKTRQRKGYDERFGDAYTFTAIERNSKLLLAWHVGRRTPTETGIFAQRLRQAIDGRCQLSTDGYGPYATAVPYAFGGQVDFAQLIKIYGGPVKDGSNTRYSPAEIMSVRLHSVCGYPDASLVCTSHVERHNLSIRMEVRRFTRLTNAHSKKRENHEYHLAIYFLYYNFCRIHGTIKTTPAVKAGITDHPWALDELLDELAIQD
ncbi:MAG: hypothetical protein L6306_07760 [Planctomycetales bacterium]|nr:hypothetical protein [Planctomycetales bacterium]